MDWQFGRPGVALLVAAAAAGGGGVAAHAATQTTAGDYQVTDVMVTSQRQAGKNTIVTVQGKIALTGAVVGDGVITERSVVHRDGSSTFHGVWTCSSCTFDGKTGAIVTRFAGKTNSNGVGRGRFTLKGRGDLAGLRGAGRFQDAEQEASPGAYTLKYHYAKS